MPSAAQPKQRASVRAATATQRRRAQRRQQGGSPPRPCRGSGRLEPARTKRLVRAERRRAGRGPPPAPAAYPKAEREGRVDREGRGGRQAKRAIATNVRLTS